MGKPKTIEEAVQRTDQLMGAGRDTLSPGLKFGEGTNDDRSRCEDDSGSVYAERSLLLVGAEPAKFEQYHASIREWWQANEFEINYEDANPGSSSAFAVNSDGFKMKIVTNQLGEAYLGVSSPCV